MRKSAKIVFSIASIFLMGMINFRTNTISIRTYIADKEDIQSMMNNADGDSTDVSEEILPTNKINVDDEEILPTNKINNADDFSYTPQIKPTYQCNQPFPNNSKLVFVHVFKTAGSTMRSFFMEYAKQCSKSAIVIQGCSSAKASSMRKGKWQPCDLTGGVSRVGKTLGRKRYVKGGKYMEEGIDIIVGHHRIDSTFALSGNSLRSRNGQEIQFVTFVRNPIARVVSGIIYRSRGRTLSWYMKKIEKTVRKGGYSDGYSKYLITPQQMEEYKRKGESPNIQQRTERIIQNLVTYNVTIGVVEQMSKSMEVLQYLMDSQSSSVSRPLFQKYASVHANPSKGVTTEMVIKKLKRNEALYNGMIEHVRYDRMVVEAAKDIHEKQYAYVKRMETS